MRSVKPAVTLIGATVLGFIGTLAWIPATHAADPGPAAKQLYLKYCSACHGETGKGEGAVSGLMQPKPTDLTQMTKKSGGSFPFVPVMEAIDGTKTVRGHGDSQMPVWGESFRTELSNGSLNHQARLRGRLMLITEYIQSIQQK